MPVLFGHLLVDLLDKLDLDQMMEPLKEKWGDHQGDEYSTSGGR